MADHVRKKLRDYLAAQFATIPAFVDTVFVGRTWQLQDDEFPAIIIKTEPENLEKAVMRGNRPGPVKRHIEIGIYILARIDGNIEDVLDEHLKSVEEKIFADPTLGKLSVETVISTINTMTDFETDKSTGAIRIGLQVCVAAFEGKPDQVLNTI